MIIIDYLQLIQLNNHNHFNRTQELGYITRKLKLLAQFLKLPIIVLSQLNRNIETRTQKKPLLSDLKESGCISYKNNIKILNRYFNEINIINLSNITTTKFKTHITNSQNSSKQRLLLLNNTKMTKYLNIFQNYMFKHRTKSEILILTHNHKYLCEKNWIKTQYTSNKTKINFIIKNSNNLIVNLSYFIKTSYIDKIEFNEYLKCYDINKENNFHLISEKVILHNSIEQDADIVMILNEKNEENPPSINEKILDLIVCKNRNGPTGSCEITLMLTTTSFKQTTEYMKENKRFTFS